MTLTGGVLHIISGCATLSLYLPLVSPGRCYHIAQSLTTLQCCPHSFYFQSSTLEYPRPSGVALASLTIISGVAMLGGLERSKSVFPIYCVQFTLLLTSVASVNMMSRSWRSSLAFLFTNPLQTTKSRNQRKSEARISIWVRLLLRLSHPIKGWESLWNQLTCRLCKLSP